MSVKRYGYNQVKKDHKVTRTNAYPYCNLHYIERGRMELTFRNKTVTLGSGCLFVLPAFVAHSYKTLSSLTLIKWIEFGGGESERLVKKLIKKAGCPYLKLSKEQALDFQIVLDRCMTPDQHSYQTSTDVYTLMMKLFDINAIENDDDNNKDPLSMITTYIEGHLHEDLRMVDLAKFGGFSPSYMSRLFKKTYNMTPGDYIYHRRVAKAKVLLTNTSLSLTAIAAECGFYDAPHLIHRFVGSEGMTPQTYRSEVDGYRDLPITER